MKNIYFSIAFLFFSILSFAQPPLQNPIVVTFSVNPSYTPTNTCSQPLKVCLNLCWSTAPSDPTCSMGLCQAFCNNSVAYNAMLATNINPGLPASGVTVCLAQLEIRTNSGYVWRHSIANADWPESTWMTFNDSNTGCCYKVFYANISGVRNYTIWPCP